MGLKVAIPEALMLSFYGLIFLLICQLPTKKLKINKSKYGLLYHKHLAQTHVTSLIMLDAGILYA